MELTPKIKAILSVLYGAAVELLDYDAKLIVAVLVLVVLDFITGVRASLLNGERFTARRMRDTIRKVTEYVMLLLAFTLVSTALITWMGWLREAAFAYVCLTELKSIVENLYGSTDAYRKILRTYDMMRRGADSELESERREARNPEPIGTEEDPDAWREESPNSNRL